MGAAGTYAFYKVTRYCGISKATVTERARYSQQIKELNSRFESEAMDENVTRELILNGPQSLPAEWEIMPDQVLDQAILNESE